MHTVYLQHKCWRCVAQRKVHDDHARAHFRRVYVLCVACCRHRRRIISHAVNPRGIPCRVLATWRFAIIVCCLVLLSLSSYFVSQFGFAVAFKARVPPFFLSGLFLSVHLSSPPGRACAVLHTERASGPAAGRPWHCVCSARSALPLRGGRAVTLFWAVALRCCSSPGCGFVQLSPRQQRRRPRLSCVRARLFSAAIQNGCCIVRARPGVLLFILPR